MKKFTQIELFLDGSYSKEERVEFIFNSRCVCGYLERKLAELDFLTTLSRVNIKCTQNKDNIGCKELKGAPYLEVTIHQDLADFFRAKSEKKQKAYIQVIESGLKMAENFMPIPREFCVETLRTFEDNGHINEWVHLEKEWKKKRVKCVFRCNLKIDACYQTQEIYIDDKLVLKALITRTKPREFLFFQDLGKATLKNGHEIHYSKGKRSISIYNIETNKLSFPPKNISEH